MLLRIEDTDSTRSGGRRAAAIVEDLDWMGLAWTGATAKRPWQQSMSAAQHAEALDSLLRNNFAYPCFCTPEELQAEREAQLRAGNPPRYSGKCARLSKEEQKKRIGAGESAAIRFRMPSGEIVFADIVRGECRFDGSDIGDFVLRRANGAFSFFFANALDDSQQGITHVLRGEDHLSNTPRQIAILNALQRPPPRYGHLPLMHAASGELLSKREGALSLCKLRERGFLPVAVNNYLARVGCALQNDSLLTLEELSKAFSFEAINNSPAAYDEAQLTHWQKRAVKQLTVAEHIRWLAEALPHHADSAAFTAFCAAARDNIALYEDAKVWAKVAFAEDPNLAQTKEAQKAISAAGSDFYQAAAQAVSSNMEWKKFCQTVSQATGQKGGKLFLPLRAALTGRSDGPAMPFLFKLIGESRARARLQVFANESGDTKTK